MTLVHEVPTHLNVEDTLIFGLTPRQLVRVSIGATLAYAAWDQGPALPDELRLGLAAVLATFGLIVGLLKPAGRPLDQWILAALLFFVLPRRKVWRRLTESCVWDEPASTPDWTELSLVPDWLGVSDEAGLAAHTHRPHVFSWREGRR